METNKNKQRWIIIYKQRVKIFNLSYFVCEQKQLKPMSSNTTTAGMSAALRHRVQRSSGRKLLQQTVTHQR